MSPELKGVIIGSSITLAGTTINAILNYLGTSLFESKRERILLRKYKLDTEWPGTYRHKKDSTLHVCGVCLSPVFRNTASPDLLTCHKCAQPIVRNPQPSNPSEYEIRTTKEARP
jgi:hypothetical protein